MTEPMPRVMGLDLSMTATGAADVSGVTRTIKTGLKGDGRLLGIRIAIAGLLDSAGRVDLVVIEDLPTHAKSAGVTGMVHGAVRSLLLERDVSYALLSPATLKAFATGRGNADKTGMTLALYKRAGLELADDNQVDAWWLRAAGLQHLGAPAVPMPAAQIGRLAKAKWPTTWGEAA